MTEVEGKSCIAIVGGGLVREIFLFLDFDIKERRIKKRSNYSYCRLEH